MCSASADRAAIDAETADVARDADASRAMVLNERCIAVEVKHNSCTLHTKHQPVMHRQVPCLLVLQQQHLRLHCPQAAGLV